MELLLHNIDETQYLVVFGANLGAISMQVMLWLVEVCMIRCSQDYHGHYPDDCGGNNENCKNFDHHHSTAARNKNDMDKQTHHEILPGDQCYAV